MPGTIQVSVLGFNGLDSSSASSQTSIKVSMGKIEYQTWDKGDFSFPLTNLRDNLVITLQDAEGNEISHTEVETRSVVEKGVWDDIFSLEGGGNVHMKLQFVLSEEERQRIRIMRESALKKKQDELSNSGHGSPRSASASYNEDSGSQESSNQSGLVTNEASPGSVPFNPFKDAKLDSDSRNRSYSFERQKSTNDRDEKEGNSPAKGMPQAANVHLTELCPQDSVPSELEKASNSKKQEAAGRAHSSVRKMISAFEGNLNQDMKPSIKPPPVKAQTRNIGMDSSLANSHLNEIETEKIIPPKATLGRVNKKEFEQTKIYFREKVQTIGSAKPIYEAASPMEIQLKELTAACSQTERKIVNLKNKFDVIQNESEEKEEKKYSKDSKRELEKAAFSRRMLDKHSKGSQSWNFSSKNQHCSRNKVTKEGGVEILQKDTQGAEGTSNGKLKSVAIWSDDHCSIGSSDLWIFPGEAKRLCMTTGGKQIMDLMGGFWDETNTHQTKLSACDHTGEVNADAGTTIDANGDGKTSSQRLRPRRENSMDPEHSRGPLGQVIRVVIMVGFATLVLLTRKRTYR